MSRRFVSLGLLALLLLALQTMPSWAQTMPGGVLYVGSNLYAAPDRQYPILAFLPPATPVMIEGRNATGNYLLVQAQEGTLRGWLPAGTVHLTPEITADALPVVGEINIINQEGQLPAIVATPLSTDPAITAILARLEATPIFTNLTTPTVYEIFAVGQMMGNRPDVFTTIGDSNTTNGDFMRPIGVPTPDCDFSAYPELAETASYFMTAAPREEQANSFVNDSLAADKGFSSAIALDPLWADWYLCDDNESPVQCEYRQTRPSVSIIMLGQIDINYDKTDVQTYRDNMERIIQLSLDDAVIPVLNTIVFSPARPRDIWEKSIQFNNAILDLAEQYQVPLINVWLAVQSLPEFGIGPDNSHLAAEVGSFCDFNGAEQRLGGTLRNLLTLQALHQLRVNVFTASAG
jgi:hypothetical protein